jgi:disulfide bond formation protein DsbB
LRWICFPALCVLQRYAFIGIGLFALIAGLFNGIRRPATALALVSALGVQVLRANTYMSSRTRPHPAASIRWKPD